MNLRLFTTLLISVFVVGGCAGSSSDGDKVSQKSAGKSGVLGKLRPKVNPQLVQKYKDEQQKARAAQLERAQAALKAREQQGKQNNMQSRLNGFGSILPKVSTEPFSAQAQTANQATLTPYKETQESASGATLDTTSLAPADDAQVVAAPAMPDTATYSMHYTPTSVPPPPPGAVAGGLVPPPPAVTLSTQAQVGGGYPGDPGNPYANPYLNPYNIPYTMPPIQQRVPVQPPPPQRPAGLFGNSSQSSGQAAGGQRTVSFEKEKKKEPDFVPIRPTGMKARSPYKQRDDLKVLWHGAISSYQFQNALADDEDLEGMLKRIEVGLPPDSTRGMFQVPSRRVSTIFRPVRVNKRVDNLIRKVQHETVQSYYRYLYTYHKFALAQQTVAARKQEIEVARSRAEKQRAAADLSTAQNDAESAREDMRAAQYELAAVAGAKSARTIIGKVTGVTPSIGALAQAEKSAQPIELKPDKGSGVLGSVGSFLFGNNDKKSSKSKSRNKKDKKVKVAKKDKKKKGKRGLFARGDDRGKDLSPSPTTLAAKPKKTSSGGMPPLKKKAKVDEGPISFELKKVNITPRKSILSVAIRNTGSQNFKFTKDVFSISEGKRKISEAAMRAEFNTTLVKPGKEVTGKITIFGKPWNDRLAVFLTDGGNNIQMKRN